MYSQSIFYDDDERRTREKVVYTTLFAQQDGLVSMWTTFRPSGVKEAERRKYSDEYFPGRGWDENHNLL